MPFRANTILFFTRCFLRICSLLMLILPRYGLSTGSIPVTSIFSSFRIPVLLLLRLSFLPHSVRPFSMLILSRRRKIENHRAVNWV